MPYWSMMNLQDPNSFMMENMSSFHDNTMMIIWTILILIMYIMLNLLCNNFNNKLILHNQTIEIIWTILPMIILILLAIPSLMILYLSDETNNPLLTIKTIGHQWYWKYEYSDFNNLEFNSFMLQYPSIVNNSFRLLDVDNRMIIPYNSKIRILITSNDVIHSWTVPSLGTKVDAIPGRINQTMILSNRPGNLFGQCSEICGMNHSFMPISIEITSQILFTKWLKSMI